VFSSGSDQERRWESGFVWWTPVAAALTHQGSHVM
jgi:hypothetical protein